eukprot:9917624-Alexandrium_andersonii.AAC.1
MASFARSTSGCVAASLGVMSTVPLLARLRSRDLSPARLCPGGLSAASVGKSLSWLPSHALDLAGLGGLSAGALAALPFEELAGCSVAGA